MSIRGRRDRPSRTAGASPRAKLARLRQGTNLRASTGWATVVQALAFVRKELAEIVRQPRLLRAARARPVRAAAAVRRRATRTRRCELRTEFVGPEGSMYEQAVARLRRPARRVHRRRGASPATSTPPVGGSRTASSMPSSCSRRCARPDPRRSERQDRGPPREARPVPAGGHRHRLAARRPGGQRLGARRDRRGAQDALAPVDETASCDDRAGRRADGGRRRRGDTADDRRDRRHGRRRRSPTPDSWWRRRRR